MLWDKERGFIGERFDSNGLLRNGSPSLDTSFSYSRNCRETRALLEHLGSALSCSDGIGCKDIQDAGQHRWELKSC